jgi:capsid protein
MTSSLDQRLSEAWDALYDALVDPREPFGDTPGGWLPVASGEYGRDAKFGGPLDEMQLAALRAECRQLALENEFAINGHENRISYLVGAGHLYRVVPRRGAVPQQMLVTKAQCELDLFLRENGWAARQQEIVRRRDRDGEAFLRFFVTAEGFLKVRFIEPASVETPRELVAQPEARLGILTEPDDVESIVGYFVDGELVPAAQIQHRRANVDANVRRGLPLYAPVRKNLRRAERLLRNMSTVAEIQSAIALVRKHRAATRGGLEAFVANGADAVVNHAGGARSEYLRRYAPGTVIDAPSTIDYEFPVAQLNAGGFVTVLQAELRAIASRLVMPEFMLSSDASNANYSSTLVAEGPAMRMFSRLQADLVNDDLFVMERVLQTAIDAGRLPPETWEQVDLVATPPSLVIRNALHEDQRYRIEHAAGILSPQTWCQRVGLDYDNEMDQLARHARQESK